MKTHYTPDNSNETACGRESKRVTTNTFEVDCRSCIIRNSFQQAHHLAGIEKEKRFLAQPGRTIMEPWRHGEFMSCKSCGGNYFRTGDRTCYGHYDNFHCINCGNVESRLTETGMSF